MCCVPRFVKTMLFPPPPPAPSAHTSPDGRLWHISSPHLFQELSAVSLHSNPDAHPDEEASSSSVHLHRDLAATAAPHKPTDVPAVKEFSLAPGAPTGKSKAELAGHAIRPQSNTPYDAAQKSSPASSSNSCGPEELSSEDADGSRCGCFLQGPAGMHQKGRGLGGRSGGG